MSTNKNTAGIEKKKTRIDFEIFKINLNVYRIDFIGATLS